MCFYLGFPNFKLHRGLGEQPRLPQVAQDTALLTVRLFIVPVRLPPEEHFQLREEILFSPRSHPFLLSVSQGEPILFQYEFLFLVTSKFNVSIFYF